VYFGTARYQSNLRTQVSGGTQWMRNRMEQVVSPQSKSMLFERMDFSQRTRKVGTAANAHREDFSPTWTNPGAKPRVCFSDGSVDAVPIAECERRATSPDPAIRADFEPSGLWNVPTATLAHYEIDRDGLENGDASLGYAAYRAYFWATRNGIKGRDIPR
jgi:hypothetical protein